MKNVILRGEHAVVISPCDSDMICEFCGTPFNNVDFSKNIVIITCSNCGRKWAATPVNWAVVPISSIIAQLHHSEGQSPDLVVTKEPTSPEVEDDPVPLVGKFYPNSNAEFTPCAMSTETSSHAVQASEHSSEALGPKKPQVKIAAAPPVLDQSAFCMTCGQEMVRCKCFSAAQSHTSSADVNIGAAANVAATAKMILTAPIASASQNISESTESTSHKPTCSSIPDDECDSYESCKDCPAY